MRAKFIRGQDPKSVMGLGDPTLLRNFKSFNDKELNDMVKDDLPLLMELPAENIFFLFDAGTDMDDDTYERIEALEASGKYLNAEEMEEDTLDPNGFYIGSCVIYKTDIGIIAHIENEEGWLYFGDEQAAKELGVI